MNKSVFIFVIAVFFLFITNLTVADSPVPSVDIRNLDGQSVDLKDVVKNDKITVISFWATWCSPCKRELENIDALLPEWRERYDVEFIAISVDDSRTADNVEPYVKGRNWDFKVFTDENNDTKRALNFGNVPYSIVINKEGNIVHNHAGYSEGDEFLLEDYIEELSAGIEE